MFAQHNDNDSPRPLINVTPLIDVLLVLLIIFMVAVPLKPSRFMAKVPAEPDDRVLPARDTTLVVTIQPDLSLRLNALTDMGTVDDSSRLSETLVKLFAERKQNRVFRDELRARADLTEDQRLEKTVFIKAPRAMAYNHIARVIDGLKGAGANPIGLQLDGLD